MSADTTAPPHVPPAAAEAFGERLPHAVRYAELLATAGIERGLLGPREAEQIWVRHLLNCAALTPLLPPAADVIDLGSGAGLPGIPLALARPDCTVTLLEPLQRRTEFLELCRSELGVPNLAVARGRAGIGPWLAPPPAHQVPVVVARAVAPLARLVPNALPLLRPDGVLLAMKGSRADGEIAQARTAGITAAMERVASSYAGHTASVVRVRRSTQGDVAGSR